MVLHKGNDLRSGENQVTGQQGRALGKERDRFSHVENHILSGRELNSLTVQLGRNIQSVGVGNHTGSRDTRAKRRPTIETLTQGPLPTTTLDLPLTMRDLVTHSIPENIVEGLALRHVLGLLANNNNQFAFIIDPFDLLRHGRHGQVISGASNRRDGLIEKHRELGKREIGLLGVLLIVQSQPAHRANVLPVQRRQKRPHVGNLLGDLVLAEDVTLDHLGFGCSGDVADAGWEDGVAVVDLAILG